MVLAVTMGDPAGIGGELTFDLPIHCHGHSPVNAGDDGWCVAWVGLAWHRIGRKSHR